MTRIGRELGKPVQALITSMDAPLGRTVGNALEVWESVECLKGRGPEDLMEVSLELAAEMLLLGGVAATHDEALEQCRRSIADGSALERFRRVVAAQGGDPRVCDDPLGVLPKASVVGQFRAERSGFITELRAWGVGQASMLLGAGRARVDSVIDPSAGIVFVKTVGDRVNQGDVIAEVHVNPTHASMVTKALAMLMSATTIADAAPVKRPLILERL
jgi:thymidine phosphorylase